MSVYTGRRRWVQGKESASPDARRKRMLRFAVQHEKAAQHMRARDPIDADTHLEYARQFRRNAG